MGEGKSGLRRDEHPRTVGAAMGNRRRHRLGARPQRLGCARAAQENAGDAAHAPGLSLPRPV